MRCFYACLAHLKMAKNFQIDTVLHVIDAVCIHEHVNLQEVIVSIADDHSIPKAGEADMLAICQPLREAASTRRKI